MATVERTEREFVKQGRQPISAGGPDGIPLGPQGL